MAHNICVTSACTSTSLRTLVGHGTQQCRLCARLKLTVSDPRRSFLGTCHNVIFDPGQMRAMPTGVSPNTASPGSRRRPHRNLKEQLRSQQHLLPQPPQRKGEDSPLAAASSSAATARRRAQLGSARAASPPPPRPPPDATHLPNFDQLNALIPTISLDDILAGKPLPADASAGSGTPARAVADAAPPFPPLERPAASVLLQRRALRPWEKAPLATPPPPQPAAKDADQAAGPDAASAAAKGVAAAATAAAAAAAAALLAVGGSKVRQAGSTGASVSRAAAAAPAAPAAPASSPGLSPLSAQPAPPAPNRPDRGGDLWGAEQPCGPATRPLDAAAAAAAAGLGLLPRPAAPHRISRSASTSTSSSKIAGTTVAGTGTDARRRAGLAGLPAAGAAVGAQQTQPVASALWPVARGVPTGSGAAAAVVSERGAHGVEAAEAVRPAEPPVADSAGRVAAEAEATATATMPAEVTSASGAVELVVRSSRAPRSLRVRSQEWVAAKEAAEAADTVAAAAAAASANSSSGGGQELFIGRQWELQLPPVSSGKEEGVPSWPVGGADAQPQAWRGVRSAAGAASSGGGGGPQLADWPPPPEPWRLQPQQQLPARGDREPWLAPAGASGRGELPAAALDPPHQPWPEAVSEPRGVLVLHEAPLRSAIDAAAADQRLGLVSRVRPGQGGAAARDSAGLAEAARVVSPSQLPKTVDQATWRLHAAVLFPELYDAEWHGCLFDFLFELWPEVGRAHVTAAGGGGAARRRLLLTTDAELAEALAAETGAPPPVPPPTTSRKERAAQLVEAAYGFAALCAASLDFAVRSALVVSVLDCMDDHDVLTEQLAARLPPPVVLRLLVPLVGRFQPPWVVDEWLAAVEEALPGYVTVSTVPRRWEELMQRLQQAQMVHPCAGLGVLHTVIHFDREAADERQHQPRTQLPLPEEPLSPMEADADAHAAASRGRDAGDEAAAARGTKRSRRRGAGSGSGSATENLVGGDEAEGGAIAGSPDASAEVKPKRRGRPPRAQQAAVVVAAASVKGPPRGAEEAGEGRPAVEGGVEGQSQDDTAGRTGRR